MLMLKINGEERSFPEDSSPLSLAALLAKLAIHPVTVVVEHNGIIVPRNAYEETSLHSDDEVELVQFVGGG